MQKVIGALLVAISIAGCSTIQINDDEHKNCLYMILDNGLAGESCSWQDSESRGVVSIAMIKPNLCHTLIHTVQTGNKYKSWEQEACYSNTNNKWLFYDR